jgi:phospholipase/carboxylesterase
MKLLSTTLVHRIIPPDTSEGSSLPTLILLHGRGADEEDLIGLLPAFDHRLLTLSVRAPFPFSFGGGYTWYDVRAIGSPEPEMFHDAYGKLAQFINDALAGYPIDNQRLFLFGFSMGAVMSFALSLTQPGLFRGVVAHSGYLPEEPPLPYRWDDLKANRFFIAHGTHDPVIPVEAARRATQLLEGTGASVVTKEYPVAHQISQESLNDTAAWLHALL